MTPEEVLEETRSVAYQILAESEQLHGSEFVFGGSIWTFDPESPYGPWNVYRGYIGYHPEWMVFVDLSVVECSRQYAESLVNRFPMTLEHLHRLGADHAKPVLTHPVRSTDDAVIWAYSIWNAALPAHPGAPTVPAFVPHGIESQRFKALHADIQGYLVVAPAEDERSTVVFWARSDSEYRVGQRLGPRHPVSLAAYGRGRRKK